MNKIVFQIRSVGRPSCIWGDPYCFVFGKNGSWVFVILGIGGIGGGMFEYAGSVSHLRGTEAVDVKYSF